MRTGLALDQLNDGSKMNKQRILDELEQLLGDSDIANAETLAKIDAMLWILYPRGVKPVQYADLVRTVRVLDRLCVWNDEQIDAQIDAPVNSSTHADEAPPYYQDLGGASANPGARPARRPGAEPGYERAYEPTYQASVSSVDYPDGDAPVVGNAADPDGSSVVSQFVDEESTAPIIDHNVFAGSIHTTKAWKPMAGFALREKLAERAAPPQYTSIFKMRPEGESD